MPQVHPDVLRSGDAAAIQAAEALVKALTIPEWGQKNLTRHKKMTEKLITQLKAHRYHPEVANFLTRLRSDTAHIDGRELHYIQQRYLDIPLKAWKKWMPFIGGSSKTLMRKFTRLAAGVIKSALCAKAGSQLLNPMVHESACIPTWMMTLEIHYGIEKI